MIRYSKQRECILNYLNSVTCHPNVEKIYTEVKKEIPNISLGTVYRNLNQLAESGKIQKLITGNNAEHYDGRTDLHSHVICRKCGKIEDICTDFSEHIELESISDYSNLSYKLTFYGICPECSREENAKINNS